MQHQGAGLAGCMAAHSWGQIVMGIGDTHCSAHASVGRLPVLLDGSP